MITENKKVWDLFIRIFHWTLVVAFVVGYLTEGGVYLHFYTGWYIGILLLIRFIWGFIGTPYARFYDFIKPPSEVIEYATSLSKKNYSNKRYIGHNPLGGLMVIALLLSLSATCISGVLLYTEDGKAALSFIGHSPTDQFDEDKDKSVIDSKVTAFKISIRDDDDDDERLEQNEYKHEKTSTNIITANDKYIEDEEGDSKEDEALKEIHDFFANFTLFLILLHIAGVIVSSRLHEENLVLAMITGKKSIEKK